MMHLYWFAFRSWFIGSSALAVHLLIVFYARDFVWDDLAPKQAVEKFSSYYHQNYTSCCKWLVSYVVMATCRCGLVSTHQGQLLIVLQAIPQEIHCNYGDEDQETRVKSQLWRAGDQLLRVVQHIAPAGCGRLDAKAQKAQRALQQNNLTYGQTQRHDDG